MAKDKRAAATHENKIRNELNLQKAKVSSAQVSPGPTMAGSSVQLCALDVTFVRYSRSSP